MIEMRGVLSSNENGQQTPKRQGQLTLGADDNARICTVISNVSTFLSGLDALVSQEII